MQINFGRVKILLDKLAIRVKVDNNEDWGVYVGLNKKSSAVEISDQNKQKKMQTLKRCYSWNPIAKVCYVITNYKDIMNIKLTHASDYSYDYKKLMFSSRRSSTNCAD
jgi:hypothetical protein